MIRLTLKIAYAFHGQIGPNPQKGPLKFSGREGGRVKTDNLHCPKVGPASLKVGDNLRPWTRGEGFEGVGA